ncbi:MAG: NAD(P)H-hydrate dehydratase [Deltaproteobacteria bacterium]|nr:NAD(P)H-hydrate dehydratase [Deltaproteobacteria bacterium]
MRLVKAAEMQEMDRLTIQELGIPGMVLMENAGRGATRFFLEHFDPSEDSHVVILCGRGNNGGDGYVIARYLHEAGLQVTILVLAPLEKISGDALANLNIARGMDLEIVEVPTREAWQGYAAMLNECDFIIDGILGTGLSSEVTGFYGQVIDGINAVGRPVMAIDIPSGLNADTGEVMGVAVVADLTVTFGFPKLGQVIFPGLEYVGRLVRIDIGIPDHMAGAVRARYRMTVPDDFVDLLRYEKQDVHKGTRGHLLILAGSSGKTGAATLTALAAIRAGAGLVTVGIPRSLNTILECKLTEAMTVPLPETPQGSLSLEAEDEIFDLMDGKTALAIGPGLSTNEETTALVRKIVGSNRLPAVIDADGLNAIAPELELLEDTGEKTVLTPHPGEMGRLTGMKGSEVQAKRVDTAARFVDAHGCHLVLKGARTLIGGPNGDMFVNPTGNPVLAGGGTGDVLTGLIGGFLARGWPMTQASVAGVYLHGLAGDLLAEEGGPTGILAGELLEVLPELISDLCREEWPMASLPPHADFYHFL